MNLDDRASVFAALGDRNRLAMVDALALSDRTFQELMEVGGLPGNLAAHHLGVLEGAGIIERRVSDGDHRRRYISLRPGRLDGLLPLPALTPGSVLFVCTHNSARSQFAAALWRLRTGGDADSAGTDPAARVHPTAVEVAGEWGLDIHEAVPKGYDALTHLPDLVVSVCDRARESRPPSPGYALHWSVPDPVAAGDVAAFRDSFASIATRIDRLALASDRPAIHRSRARARTKEALMTLQTNPAQAAMSTEQRLRIKQSAAALQRRWEGRMNIETIERFLAESYYQLLPNAKVTNWLPVVAERLANDRLRALVRLESDHADLNPSVLFLCVHNAGRSQMAAGFMRHLAGDQVEVFSGGSEPVASLNAAAVAAMAEKGIDISRELPQPWADDIVRASDVVVTMGCGDACPFFPGKRYLDWELEDPSGKTLEQVRPIRDDIERRVRGLMAELGVEPVAA